MRKKKQVPSMEPSVGLLTLVQGTVLCFMGTVRNHTVQKPFAARRKRERAEA